MASALAIITLIRSLALVYGVDQSVAVTICRLESAFNPLAVGDDGEAVGLWQWHLKSWEHVRKRMGRSLEDDRADPLESTETALYAMGVLGLSRWWSTYGLALKEVGGWSFLDGQPAGGAG